ncbi:vWA domain-containing protein [Jannaschia pohangensis]|uniref:Ca-activated chloride channel family protein n=1 Tax=Jannaschia pohangensis TaxID=390807 RepID=A0A1I3TB32_9RHOB|nr:von Willebrand factor type A domain-containing protein [Jannaschia pohangensis]SFJ67830.1 Ca-activated chloride channel family protein [Jannaschia pohangensis]
MTDDLDKLSGPVPAPRQSARDAALSAGLSAFDGEFSDPTTKGSATGGRLRGVINTLRSLSMPNFFPAGSRPALAALLVASVALPTTIFVINEQNTIAETDALVPARTEGGLVAQDDTRSVQADAPSTSVVAPTEEAAPEPIAIPQPTTSEIATPRAPVPVSPQVSAVPVPTHTARPDLRARSEMAEPMVQGAFRESADMVVSPGFTNDPTGSERYAPGAVGDYQSVADAPVSTFSADVDTASYARMRRAILAGQVPPPEMIRPEEVLNAFAYDYPVPETRDVPFRATTTLTDSPWTDGAQLLHIGIQGYDLVGEDRPPANLVFLIDASGSMESPDKLPLLIRSLEMLVDQMAPEDTIAIAVYAGNAGIVLEPTPARERTRIRAALNSLRAGGGTAGAAGIETAYDLAQEAFIEGGANRVILATDGDFNVGPSDPLALERLIAEKRETGVFLSVLGFGTGNLRDDTMQALAQAGNGTAAYIDTLSEARRVLVEQATGSIFTIAKDVKLQVEFNPAVVESYRLVGYETRALSREDFNDDRVDAGEIGAGHRVTAIYEVLPQGVRPDGPPLRYAEGDTATETATTTTLADELGFLQIRYKAPDGDESRLITAPIVVGDAIPLTETSDDVRFSVAAAGFAEKLRGAPGLNDVEWADVIALARGGLGDDTDGRRRELVELMELGASLTDR